MTLVMLPAQKMEPATLRKFEWFEVGPLLPKLPFGEKEYSHPSPNAVSHSADSHYPVF